MKVNIDDNGPWLKPKDFIAFLVIVGWTASKFFGFDGSIDAAAMLILGYYFVKRQEGKDNGR